MVKARNRTIHLEDSCWIRHQYKGLAWLHYWFLVQSGWHDEESIFGLEHQHFANLEPWFLWNRRKKSAMSSYWFWNILIPFPESPLLRSREVPLATFWSLKSRKQFERAHEIIVGLPVVCSLWGNLPLLIPFGTTSSFRPTLDLSTIRTWAVIQVEICATA